MRASWIAGTAVMLFACGKSEASAKPTAAVSAPSPAVDTPQPAPSKEPSALERLDSYDYPQAVAFALLGMEDTANADSKGAIVLAYWASTHMVWSDVAVAKDETSFALVRKDPDSERTKRLCVSGQIVQISVDKMDGAGKLFEGLLLSNGGNIFRFIAAGSTGDLVQSSYARMCGVVIGTYDYANSGGGTGHAVSVVGMFDLPANRALARPVGAPPVAR